MPRYVTIDPGLLFHPRLAACLALFTCLGWYTSSYRALLGNKYPNSVCACCKDAYLGVGFVSSNGATSLFLERDPDDCNRGVWSERPDGHFCTFRLPTGGPTGWEVGGLAIRIDSRAIAWCCPYWLMALFWAGIAGFVPRRFSIAGGLTATTCVAIYLTLATSRVVLPLLVLLNLLTVIAMLVGLAVALGRAYRDSKAGRPEGSIWREP